LSLSQLLKYVHMTLLSPIWYAAQLFPSGDMYPTTDDSGFMISMAWSNLAGALVHTPKAHDARSLGLT
jgi:hypothetical protein